MPITSREKEAMSGRFENFAAVVPLSDGSYAVFSHDRTVESMLIVEDTDDLLLAIASRANMNQRKTPSKGLPGATADADELMNDGL